MQVRKGGLTSKLDNLSGKNREYLQINYGTCLKSAQGLTKKTKKNIGSGCKQIDWKWSLTDNIHMRYIIYSRLKDSSFNNFPPWTWKGQLISCCVRSAVRSIMLWVTYGIEVSRLFESCFHHRPAPILWDGHTIDAEVLQGVVVGPTKLCNLSCTISPYLQHLAIQNLAGLNFQPNIYTNQYDNSPHNYLNTIASWRATESKENIYRLVQ